ncbi:MAG: TolC family protein, partial [Armatimonadota bacterium]
FRLSGPLYDGGLSREQVKQAELNRDSSKANYTQNYRTAKAEIESTLYEIEQDMTRYDVAQSALKAAQVNYDAASEAQKLGAGTLIDVLTAQVSLVTAEQNAVQALYDLLTAQVKLKLVTGQPLPGETG